MNHFAISICCLLATTAAAGPEIRCTLDSSAISKSVTLSPDPDPYRRTLVDYDNGYRFAAQWLAEPSQLKTYVYFRPHDKWVLVSTGEWPAPTEVCTQDFGIQRFHAGELEREFLFHCRQACAGQP